MYFSTSDRVSKEPALDAPPVTLDARLKAIYVSPGHDYWGRQGEGRLQHGILSVPEVECVACSGLRGDRYFNYRKDFKGQVTFFDEQVAIAVQTEFKLPKLPASVFRRNLIVAGKDLDLRGLLGRRFLFQGVEFEGSQECRPCEWMDRVVSSGCEAFLKLDFRGGLRAKVISGGILRVDSPV